MRILLDGMGGDNAPEAIIQGAVSAQKLIDHEIIVIGQEDVILPAKKKHGGKKLGFVPASEVISNDDAPVKAVRSKKDSSIVKGIELVKNGEADVFISAGSTGALMAGGLFILGRIQGIDRPSLATVYPVIGQEPSLLIDAGANAECKPNNLLEFATMGSIYMEKVMGRKNPRVGLVNNGAEEHKGTTLTKAAHELLSRSPINFIGNVETRDLPNGVCDVIVTDGFTGNALLKLTEGMGLMVLRELKKRFTKNGLTKMGSLFLGKELVNIKSEFNYVEYGGAPILGVKGAILKMHGSSDKIAVEKTILKAIPYVENNVVDVIQNSTVEIEEIVQS
ncbi:MAG: phosphate acyltransferase PlsX [Firmicutes bacterium]|nr:phosphate acyltransferase PlsX [Bacillota bacterium]